MALICTSAAFAQSPLLINQPIDDQNLVILTGNTRPEATAANDLGRVDDNLYLNHMFLQLKRSPQQASALEALMDQLQDSKSPNFHHWLTADQFGDRFGLAAEDLNVITSWLVAHGFVINNLYANHILIDFSGTAGQIRTVFHSEIHNLSVNGEIHIANMVDPSIPAALANAVVGIVSLHDFMPRPTVERHPFYTYPGNGMTQYDIVPADVATIYNFNPVFASKITGGGQTVAVIEDSDVYSIDDFTTFRATFGLNRFGSGTLLQVHPRSAGTNNCADPGANQNDLEATLDAEYASAAAPGATIELASCSDTTTTFGGYIALVNLMNSGKTPASISISYADCEPKMGASGNASYYLAFQQAVAQNASVYVAAGDWGTDVCQASFDANVVSTDGINVNGYASTPYNVAVGGTNFADALQSDSTTYFDSTNSKYYGSAKSYIPEIPWNSSCADILLANFSGFPLTYGANGFCNSNEFNLLDIIAASGGPSGCATGKPSSPGVVSGTCKGYPRPAWQNGVPGLPGNAVRALPDVSLFASSGVLFHSYIVCYSDPNGGAPCTGAPSTWFHGGGTSFASPLMAGVQALINQSQGGPQGNPNPVLYKLAGVQYNSTELASCNSWLGNGASSTCIFYDITRGDNDIPCQGLLSCYDPSGVYGVISRSDSSYAPGFPATSGWDYPSGLGLINVANLLANWSSAK